MNNNVKLWRGLGYDSKGTSSLEMIKNDLLTKGDMREDKAWLQVPNIEHHSYEVDLIINSLFNEDPNVERYGVKKSKYVCGDTIGADFYATRNYRDGIILEIETNIDRLVIDGRDFLYYAIPKIIENGMSAATKESFENAFGKKSIDYIEKGKKLLGCKRNILFRFIDYFCMDFDIINSNLHSNVLIHGRHSTRFKGAFGVIDGIKPTDIVEIIKPGSKLNITYDYIIDINNL